MRLSAALLLLCLVACKSSEPEEPDPVAVDYCAACSEFDSCERVVENALIAPCPDETRLYYQCLTDSACDADACAAEWEAREACIAPSDETDGGEAPE